MIFTIITFIAAFAIEAIGTVVSVIGLSALFGANPIIIALAIALDVGKIVVVSLLYKYWRQLGVAMKGYAIVACAITMLITSAGAGGYLTGEFQKAIMGTQEGSLKVETLKAQQAKYEDRKKQIDTQIASLPENTTVNQRLRLMRGFKAEQDDLQAKISEIDAQLPALQVSQIGVEAKAGPILAIAKAFNIPVEQAVKWVILAIIIVFDPLAVFLIIAGNFLFAQWQSRRLPHKTTTFTDLNVATKVEPRNNWVPPHPMPPARAPAPAPAPAEQRFAEEPEEIIVESEPIGRRVQDEPAEVLTPVDTDPTPASTSPEIPIIRAEVPPHPVLVPQPTKEEPELEPQPEPEPEEEREKITLSTLQRRVATSQSLANVRPDPETVVDHSLVRSKTRGSIYTN